MKLVIKNLGSLQHAEIDLSKRFYLFTGYNNTGKTYVTKLLYQIFQGETIASFALSSYNKINIEKETNEIELSDDLVDSVLTQFKDYVKEIVLPKTLKVSKNNSILKNFGIEFQYDKNNLKATYLQSIVSGKVKEGDEGIEFFRLVKETNSLIVSIEEVKSSYQDFESMIELFKQHGNALKKRFDNAFLVTAFLNLLFGNNEEGFFLSANRGFLLENANDMLMQEQKRKTDMAESLLDIIESEESNKEALSQLIRKRYQTNYTFDVDILLKKIIEIRNEKNSEFIEQGTNFYTHYLQKMQDIMGGEIVMEKLSSVSNWTEKFKMQGADNEESINLYLASSSANQLALLFQFFKYWAKPERNFLMIDEPEINLHPENQIKVINLLLAFASEKNNRVLVTTHSPLIGEVLNNHLIANMLGDEGYTLSPEETAVYYFNGRVMSEQIIDDYGTDFTSFKMAQDEVMTQADDLIERTYNKLKPVY